MCIWPAVKVKTLKKRWLEAYLRIGGHAVFSNLKKLCYLSYSPNRRSFKILAEQVSKEYYPFSF